MAPVIQRFLIEGSSRFTYTENSAENLINYLDKNLIVLKEKLNETNFDRILTVIWESSAQSLSDTIHLSIEVSVSTFYIVLSLQILCNIFHDIAKSYSIIEICLYISAKKTSTIFHYSIGNVEGTYKLFLW